MRRANPSVLLAMVLLALLAAAFGPAACGGGSGPDIPLLYTFTPGDSWVHEMTSVATGTAEDMGDQGPTQADETTKTRLTAKVESVGKNGTATISLTTQTLELVSNGETVDLAGQQPQTITITMDRAGKVLSTVGAADAASGLIESGNFLDARDLESRLGSMIFPDDGKAKIGEEWRSVYSVPLSGLDRELTVETTSKLVSVATENGRQVATIEYVSALPMDMELDLGALFSRMSGSGGDGSTVDIVFKIAMKGDVRFTGTTTVDTATGRAIRTDSNGTMDLSLEVTEAPQTLVPSDQRGPYRTNMTYTMSEILVD